MKLVGLSRQIVLSMVAIALSVALLAILMAWIFYYIWGVYWPDYKWPENTLVPSGPEWLLIGGTMLAALALALSVAVKLSRRILLPLNSVAEGMRRMAEGHLDARAAPGDRSLGEASQLADDFNALVSKLQRMTDEQRFWNAAIAHELRTPVTVLKGRLQGLADGVFKPDDSQFRSLLAQVEGLARLIEDLRVISLVESGHLDLQRQDTNLATEIHDVISMVEGILLAAGQRVISTIDSVPMNCDPVRIRQALLALLDNVRRHAIAGDIRIDCSIRDGWCCLSVEDSGPGIAEDFMPHVFTAFRRGDSSVPGSGLGLAVVAAIAQAHGGHARCRSSGRGGSVFELTWPQTE